VPILKSVVLKYTCNPQYEGSAIAHFWTHPTKSHCSQGLLYIGVSLMVLGFKSPNNSLTKNSKVLSIADATALTEKMESIFSEIKDPRVQRNRVHLLTDILIIAILSVIAGSRGWEDMENYGLSKYEWLEQFLKLPEGIPCADTFRRVFERINPKVFEQCFRRWVESIVETVGAQVIPIDGKTLKGSYDRALGKTALPESQCMV